MAGHEPVEADGVQSLEEAVEVDTPFLAHNKAFIVDGPTMGLDTVTSLLGQSLVLHLSAEDVRTQPPHGLRTVVLAALEQVGRLDGEAKVGPVDARHGHQLFGDLFLAGVFIPQLPATVSRALFGAVWCLGRLLWFRFDWVAFVVHDYVGSNGS